MNILFEFNYRWKHFYKKCAFCKRQWWKDGDIYIASEEMCETCWLEFK